MRNLLPLASTTPYSSWQRGSKRNFKLGVLVDTRSFGLENIKGTIMKSHFAHLVGNALILCLQYVSNKDFFGKIQELVQFAVTFSPFFFVCAHANDGPNRASLQASQSPHKLAFMIHSFQNSPRHRQ